MMRGLSYPESVLVCFPNSLLSSGVFGFSLLLLPLLLSLLTWLLTLALGLSFCKNKSKLQLRRPGGGPILTPVIITGVSAGLKCFHLDLLAGGPSSSSWGFLGEILISENGGDSLRLTCRPCWPWRCYSGPWWP